MDNEVDWEKRWKEGQTLWDAGKASPALKKLIEDEDTKHLIPSQGIGLVPGCGSGYDVELLATPERHMTGLDYSPTAVEVCRKIHPQAADKNYDFMCADFYNFEIPAGGYDLAYDYTFLCAMPPRLRPDWAARYPQLIKKGGVLIALMFPLEEKEGGPPFSLSRIVVTQF
ncbi:S-adenosyl-L-methionine-dependent methyltransferase [Radiomyces spectabilis]|uniref:S-adenosyl-L-methionine-dependent methyltransferase n=1 Tax=Radiomyces spectabilis TaxID=64574 RepID=UPI00221E5E9A|nr:S-adenosyl-L-methionine-dependent methyltransferase [Radiomyces spectabilis]KAI8371427.1 S-adenosyl-L-methionine-dependent methyltransferase [Radiomyces spectabilis]